MDGKPTSISQKSILIFGAGKIGRSFIGQLFGLAGYEVIFVDVDQEIIHALNLRRSYQVIIKGDREESLTVPCVRGVSGYDREAVAREVSAASLMAVSVGKNALEKVVPVIAEGLNIRYQTDPDNPLDIIIAENMRSAAEFMREKLSSCLPENYPLDRFVGFVETSIGKMVPIMSQSDLVKDPLMVFAEPYNTLIVDKKGFRSPVPDIPGLAPKENIKAWVDRKAFIHNLGHATAAYCGAYKHPGATYIFEVLDDREVYSFTREVMFQAADVLQTVYPDDFSPEDMAFHIDDLLTRFQNKALKDTVFRVGQDRPRKLGPDDRFVGIVRMAISRRMRYDKILKAMAYAFFFQSTDENGNISVQDELFDKIQKKGVDFALQKICGFDPKEDKNLVNGLKKHFSILKKEKLNRIR